MEWGLPVPQEAKSAVDSMGRRKAAGGWGALQSSERWMGPAGVWVALPSAAG